MSYFSRKRKEAESDRIPIKNSGDASVLEQEDKSKVYQEELIRNREELYLHGKYAKEKRISSLVSAGEVEKLRGILHLAQDKSIGHMSLNPYRKQLYAIIIGVAVTARAAMDGGLNEEEAYTLSDIYIREADACNMPEQLWELYVRMVLDFTERVRKSKKDTTYSETIQMSIDYMLHNLHYDTTLKEIADNAGLSETYFSALFKKETGETVSEFIQKSRIKEAQSLLQYSDYTLMEVSKYLGFCSQSHFSKTFRRFTGMTPGQYRKQYFKRTW